MKKLIFIIILSVVCSAQAQTDDKETLKRLNQNVLLSYKNQKMDDALRFARQAVDLSIKINGADNLETATAYTNLGVIYRERKKYKESIESLQTAANIYQKLPDAKGKNSVEIYEALALSQLLGGKKEEAEASYLKATETAETKFGKESKEVFSPTLNLANFYARDGKFEKADELYLKTYALAIKNFGREGKEIEQIEDSRSCLFGGRNLAADKVFDEAKNKLFGANAVRTGILNGKAKFLPKPRYPVEARTKRLSGTTPIRVLIDEQGNVIETKSICRNDVLGEAAEESARSAKFYPIILDGKPVRVSGIIIYSFIAP
jgi:tetratricopeptide (TPR) repeat protein